MHTRILTSRDIAEIVCHVGVDPLMDELVAALATAYRQFDAGKWKTPARTGFSYDQPELGLVEWMPLLRNGSEVMLKVVGYHPSNPATRKIPTVLSTILIFDTATGGLLAQVDATFLTAFRTGAASAVCTEILSHDEASVLGLIGCGAQSVTQFHALSRVRPIRELLVYDLDEAASRSLPDRLRPLQLDDIRVASAMPHEIVSRADIVCTATSVPIQGGPVFADGPVRPWLHINAVGSDFPGKTEVPVSLLRRSLVAPDFVEQATVEGECQQLRDEEIDVS